MPTLWDYTGAGHVEDLVLSTGSSCGTDLRRRFWTRCVVHCPG
jgi:hypothetical protein